MNNKLGNMSKRIIRMELQGPNFAEGEVSTASLTTAQASKFAL
jgi:hypothetical protein